MADVTLDGQVLVVRIEYVPHITAVNTELLALRAEVALLRAAQGDDAPDAAPALDPAAWLLIHDGRAYPCDDPPRAMCPKGTWLPSRAGAPLPNPVAIIP